jgi:Flp pilus assembly pilin Flp
LPLNDESACNTEIFTMWKLIKCLWADEDGFIISAELVLVGTIVGLAMIAGLSEVSYAVNHELNDVAQGFSAYNDHGRDRRRNDKDFGPSKPAGEKSRGDLHGNN